jgi:hypothetical protein
MTSSAGSRARGWFHVTDRESLLDELGRCFARAAVDALVESGIMRRGEYEQERDDPAQSAGTGRVPGEEAGRRARDTEASHAAEADAEQERIAARKRRAERRLNGARP